MLKKWVTFGPEMTLNVDNVDGTVENRRSPPMTTLRTIRTVISPLFCSGLCRGETSLRLGINNEQNSLNPAQWPPGQIITDFNHRL